MLRLQLNTKNSNFNVIISPTIHQLTSKYQQIPKNSLQNCFLFATDVLNIELLEEFESKTLSKL